MSDRDYLPDFIKPLRDATRGRVESAVRAVRREEPPRKPVARPKKRQASRGGRR